MLLRVIARRMAIWTVTSCLLAQLAVAQGPLSFATSLSSQQRDVLYAELASEAAAIEGQLSLLKKLVRLVEPTVVHIEAKKEPTRPGSKPPEEAGSGIVIQRDNRFYVLTNRHVIDEAGLANIAISLSDGQILHPTHVWSDRETDVAVLALSESDLIPARVGNSDEIEIGEFVVAVGSPFGLSHSVTYGIISAKGRRDLQLGDGSIRYQDFLQTDAAINPGNSGGPLLNLRGEVIGINTAIASSSGGSEGIGFTIPISMAMTVADQFIEHGRPRRGFLGVNLDKEYGRDIAIRLGLPRARGALVQSTIEGSPARSADFRANDVVLEFDGHTIEDDDHLIKVVGFTPVGKQVEVVVFRAGKLVRLHITLDERRVTRSRQ